MLKISFCCHELSNSGLYTHTLEISNAPLSYRVKRVYLPESPFGTPSFTINCTYTLGISPILGNHPNAAPYSKFSMCVFVCVDEPKWRTVSNFNDAVLIHLANLDSTDIIFMIYLRVQGKKRDIPPPPFTTYRGLPYKDGRFGVGGGEILTTSV